MAYINVSAIRKAGGEVSTSGGVTTITTKTGEKIVAPQSSTSISAVGGAITIQEKPVYSEEQKGFETTTTTYTPTVVEEAPKQDSGFRPEMLRRDYGQTLSQEQKEQQVNPQVLTQKVYAPKREISGQESQVSNVVVAKRPFEAPDDTILSRFITKQEQAKYDIQLAGKKESEKGFTGKVKAGIVEGGRQLVQGAVLDPATLGVAIVTQPKETGKAIVKDITSGEFIVKTVEGLYTEPVRTVASFWAFGRIGRAVKGVSKPVLNKVITPKEVGATKSATVTVTTPTGTTSETIAKSIQQIGRKQYTIETTAKGTTTATGLSKTTTTTGVSKIIAGQNLPKKTITTTTLGVEKGTKATYLTKGQIGKEPIRQLDVVVSKTKGDYTQFGGAQFKVGEKITDLQLKEYYAGASKKVLETQRLTESGQPFDITTVSKTGTINIGVKQQPLVLKAGKPSAQQLRTLKSLESGKSPSITVVQKTTSPQATEIITKRTGVEVAKQLYIKESTKSLPIIFSVVGTTNIIKPSVKVEKPKQILEIKQETKPSQAVKPITTVKPTTETKPKKDTITYKKTITKTFQSLKPSSKISQVQKPSSIVDTISQTKTEQKQEQKQDTILQQVQKQVQKPFINYQVPKQLPIAPKFGYVKPESGKKSLFETLVRRKGKFESRGTFKTQEEATRRGLFVTGQTASASFKVLKDKQTLDLGRISERYKPSTKEKGVQIQRSKFRISSAGEKAEIPGKARLYKKKTISGGKLV